MAYYAKKRIEDNIKNELKGREEMRICQGERKIKTIVEEDGKLIVKEDNE